MALLERARAAMSGGAVEAAAPPATTVAPKPLKVDEKVKKRIYRAKEGLRAVSPQRRLNVEFARNNHFVSIDKSGTKLDRLSTVSKVLGGEKPDHRVRRSHDILAPILKAKISAVTQRIPAYEVIEASSDPEDYSAARTSEKVLRAGYEIWGVRKAFRRAVWHALVTEEAFIMPWFDETVGPYVEQTDPEDPEGEPQAVGMGEIRYAVFGGLEVGWEPGVQFEDSPYYVIVQARPREEVEAEPGFIGPPLEANASASDDYLGYKPKGSDQVLVIDYLERPCAAQPNGRRIVEANGRQIFQEEDYPLFDQNGDVVDRPCLHRISYAIDGDSDRDRGLVSSLIETIRDFDFSSNKAMEYLQLVLVPQVIGPEGALKSPLTDTPGSYIEIDEDAWERGLKPELRQMPSMPGEFGNERDRAQGLLGFISSENAIPSGVEAAKAIATLATKDALAFQDFMEDVADAFAATGRDSLCLVQVFYDDERMMQFRGRTGWESIPDFKGADIRNQTDVRVSPGSIEPMTREVIERRIINASEMLPGFFPPEVLLAAFSAGDFDRLNESYEEDEAQANFIVAQLRAGTFWELPPRPAMPGEAAPELDPETGQPRMGPDGQPVMLSQIPGWMPRPFDNVPVFKRRMESFMKSDEWRHLDPSVQQATGLYYSALLELEARNAAKQAVVQNQTAERLGAENAAKPQQPKTLPSQPSPALPAGE